MCLFRVFRKVAILMQFQRTALLNVVYIFLQQKMGKHTWELFFIILLMLKCFIFQLNENKYHQKDWPIISLIYVFMTPRIDDERRFCTKNTFMQVQKKKL